ncbi:MAG: hypothetical protein COS89_09230 [Deltaproteobacteria bacterium CG07_land_8_20_14_0_80_38_7]|nr:MAG: hypothetical protein COS89_09230 [Deltaproteobacteria bacterium CG07_land_8_20_14_0_80_38_7]
MFKRKFISIGLIILSTSLLITACKQKTDKTPLTEEKNIRVTQKIEAPVLTPPKHENETAVKDISDSAQKDMALNTTPTNESQAAETSDVSVNPTETVTPEKPLINPPESMPAGEDAPTAPQSMPAKTEPDTIKSLGTTVLEMNTDADVNNTPKEIATTLIVPPEPTETEDTLKTKTEATEVTFSPKIVDAKTNIDIILDASGSQTALFSATVSSKFDIQKRAVEDIILSLKQTEFPRNVGIRIFGSEKPLTNRDCSDTKLIYPVSEPDLDSIKEILAPLEAKGESPIAAALDAASNDFPPMTNVDQIIVLIADGMDTCETDPCETAKAIHTNFPNTSIHVIGFDISQEDAQKIECIASNSDGKFHLARNESELRKALDEAVNSKVPYNLRLSTVVGATPISTSITVFKGSSNEIVKKTDSFGTKLLSLPAGIYDIMVEYAGSPELKKPVKVIKGVQILEKTKVEQTINFDFGAITLSTTDANAKLTNATYEIRAAGSPKLFAEANSFSDSQTIFLEPGSYDITAIQEGIAAEQVSITEQNITVKQGESISVPFLFQEGTITMKGITTQNIPLPFIFQIYKSDNSNKVFTSGALTNEGGNVTISPGSYDIIFIGQDPEMIANPRTKVSGIIVKASETTKVVVSFEMGALTLNALDNTGKPIPAIFNIKILPEGDIIAKVSLSTTEKSVTIPIPPGKYEVLASKLIDTEPKPTVLITNIEITATQPISKTAQFILGTLRVRGTNAKGQAINSSFSVYRGGTDDLFVTAPPSSDWITFEVPEGIYDVSALNMEDEQNTKPPIWIKDIDVKVGKQVSHEAIFTAGKLKIIGRGANNQIIKCHFKIFKYGSDHQLVGGDTGDDWQIFEIQPDSYYLEAGYVDPEASVLLKKWINIKVDENEILEVILNF